MPYRVCFLYGAAGHTADKTNGGAIVQHSFADGVLVVQVAAKAVGDEPAVFKNVVLLQGLYFMRTYRYINGELANRIGCNNVAIIEMRIQTINFKLHALYRNGTV